jgi:DNA-binding NarL/FixJ family response regulator
MINLAAPVRLVVIDDHALFCEGLKNLLHTHPEFEVVGDAPDARSGYELIERTRPDLALVDLRLPGVDGISATRELRRRYPKLRIAMLSGFNEADYVLDSLAAGANGYLLKAQPLEETLDGIRAISRGETFLSAQVPHPEIERRRSPEGTSSYDHLSKREKEVFHLLVHGQSNAQVAKELFISVKTVESHREHILKKLDCHSIVELVRFAARHGFVD